MQQGDYNDSMPGLPPVQRAGFSASELPGRSPANEFAELGMLAVADTIPGPRFRRHDEVVCIDGSGTELSDGVAYHVDADYGDVNGQQLIYLVGYPDNCPFAAWRFVRAEEYGMTQADKEGIKNVLTAEDRGLHGPDASMQAGDEVNLPSHYARFKIEPIRFLVENFGPAILVGKIVKYSMRYDGKNGLQDIDKAIRCATMLRAFVAGDPDWWKRKAG